MDRLEKRSAARRPWVGLGSDVMWQRCHSDARSSECAADPSSIIHEAWSSVCAIGSLSEEFIAKADVVQWTAGGEVDWV